MEQAAKRFFTSSQYAVVGATQNKAKFGFRIFAWYHAHALKVTPVNPSRPTIDLPSKSYTTVLSPAGLPEPLSTGVSFVTPPSITRTALAEAKSVGVKSVWLQPGSFDDEILEYAKDNFENAIGGFEGGTVGGEGWCVLVDGEQALTAAGKTIQRQKL